ncbi:hypothetical protein SARC_02711 [Sphaeroforma arctica JP610]|uniref:Uncharacterized protein n=1 Tax=Sphaeroforma arctica JP610 TaxID=667725 RepID=A0A0L0GA24_9EUKA|nr:hypothetical protein SARC_02711 [Sphaeroforma arctica JP610]KNC85083.1 hypothetical protein SARC_02711 [Sphaeroforma arctica JP610]|eukprot:XP_014158985.1 hypothetical protein SARC_02711 [Sphaeroforma arctica JP610]
MPTATRAGVYGREEGGAGADDAGDSPAGGTNPGSSSSQPTPGEGHPYKLQQCRARYLLDSIDTTETTKGVPNELRYSETQMTKHYKDPEQLNRIIIVSLRHHPVENLLEKFLNDMQNKTLNVEVHTERLHRTMQVLEECYRNSDKETIHTQNPQDQALTYYGQQKKVDVIIKADKLPDESEGHLSDMKHTTFYSPTEAIIRVAAKVQAERLYRERKKRNSQPVTRSQSQNGTTTATKPETSQTRERRTETNQANRTNSREVRGARRACMSLL